MRRPMFLLAVTCALGFQSGAGADEALLPCAELAERRAARQYAEDNAALLRPA